MTAYTPCLTTCSCHSPQEELPKFKASKRQLKDVDAALENLRASEEDRLKFGELQCALAWVRVHDLRKDEVVLSENVETLRGPKAEAGETALTAAQEAHDLFAAQCLEEVRSPLVSSPGGDQQRSVVGHIRNLPMSTTTFCLRNRAECLVQRAQIFSTAWHHVAQHSREMHTLPYVCSVHMVC